MPFVDIAGERAELCPERALWWPRERTLFIADLHLGKPAAFAARGVPVPAAVTRADLARLDSCVRRLVPRRLVVLGDLLHARTGRDRETMSAAADWCAHASSAGVQLLLVRGNHDAHAGDPPPDWGFACVDAPHTLGPFSLRHEPIEPTETSPAHVLCGHIHPVVTLAAPGCRPERARCFVVSPRQTLLPAFGSFTGGALVRPNADERVFALGDDTVIELPRSALVVTTRPRSGTRLAAPPPAPRNHPRD